MGILDSMFGGGTKLTLTLDTPQSSPGGLVGGQIHLLGGKKPLQISELTIQLVYIYVRTRPGSSVPSVDTRVLLTQTLAAGAPLPSGAQQTYSFRFTVPRDAEITSGSVSYLVRAAADIPGVKDPCETSKLKIVEADDDAHRVVPVEDIFARFPDLRSPNEEAQCEALRELLLACYGEGSQLLEVEPFLADLLRKGTTRVRHQALETWGTLVDNRVKPHHLETLYAVINTPGLDQDTFDEAIRAACKFAEEGALPLVQQLAQHPNAHAREKVAAGLYFDAAENFAGKRELIMALAGDPEARVRAAAVRAFSNHLEDTYVVQGLAQQVDGDPAPEVQAAGIGALGFAYRYGHAQYVLSLYEKHLANPHEMVRKEIANTIHLFPKAHMQGVWNIASRLMSDPDEEVRRTMAFQFCNMGELPEILPLVQHTIQNDPSAEVRREAIGSAGRLMTPEAATAYYTQVLSADRSEETMWAVLNGLRGHADTVPAKKMLVEMTHAPYPYVVEAAREALTS